MVCVYACVEVNKSLILPCIDKKNKLYHGSEKARLETAASRGSSRGLSEGSPGAL